MANDFTPGPYWLNVAEGGECRVMGRNAKILFRYPASQEKLAEAHVKRLQKGHEEANARLIAAAPDLYEALEVIAGCGAVDVSNTAIVVGDKANIVLQQAWAALRKARGEA